MAVVGGEGERLPKEDSHAFSLVVSTLNQRDVAADAMASGIQWPFNL